MNLFHNLSVLTSEQNTRTTNAQPTMTTIIYCDPQSDSFNHEILNSITSGLTDEGREHTLINLYGEHFNPVLESAMPVNLTTADVQARRYAQTLARTNQLILIFPIWWGAGPAMLKGLIDKAFVKGIVYDTTPEGAVMPCLSISHTEIITTSEEQTSTIASYIMGYFAPITLTSVGINGVKWSNLDYISHRTPAQRSQFIAELLSRILA